MRTTKLLVLGFAIGFAGIAWAQTAPAPRASAPAVSDVARPTPIAVPPAQPQQPASAAGTTS